MDHFTGARVERLIDQWANEHPDTHALLFRDRCWTYAHLRREMDRRAAVLVAAGLEPGDVVASTELATADIGLSFLGCCRADCTFLYLTAKMAATELAAMLDRAGVRLILTADGCPHPATPAIPTLPLHLPGASDPGAAAEATQRSLRGSPASVAILQPTSGTTGALPKLARQTHRMLTWQQLLPAVRRSWWEPSSVYYRPRAHYFSVRDLCESLTSGGTHILSDVRRPSGMEREMARHSATVLGAVPAMLQLLVDHEEPPPPGLAIRYVRTGAATLQDSVAARAGRRYGATILQDYGSTEGGSMIGTPREGAPAGSVGKPYSGVEVRIVDERGNDVPSGEAGQIIVRSPGLMLGYVDDPVATQRALREGWLWTGDSAWQDDDGYIYLSGRYELRINVGGFKVIPEHVEAVLMGHPDIREAVVTGMPDGRYGEVVRAVVVPRGACPAIGELRRYCRQRLADYEVPAVIEFREQLPRSALGKILRAQV